MNPRLLLAFFGSSILMLGLGASVGHYRGHQQGLAEGRERERLDSSIAEAVHLTLAARKEASGDPAAARQLHYRLLYAAALRLEESLGSEVVSMEDLEEKNVRGVLESVVAHYWEQPDSTSFFKTDEWARKSSEQKLTALFEKYRPSTPK